jgi:hypothetical protein
VESNRVDVICLLIAMTHVIPWTGSCAKDWLGDDRLSRSPGIETSHATDEEQVRQYVDNVCALQLARDADRETFTGKLVDDIEHPEGSSVVRPVVHEVVRPDMV